MHDCAELFSDVMNKKTRVWLSSSVQKDVMKYRRKNDPNGLFWKKLCWCSVEAGFEHAELAEMVRHEGNGVYRFGIKESLFRLIGFYDGGKSNFIVIDSFLKQGQTLNAAERKRVEEVARVAKAKLWRKVGPDGIPRNLR